MALTEEEINKWCIFLAREVGLHKAIQNMVAIAKQRGVAEGEERGMRIQRAIYKQHRFNLQEKGGTCHICKTRVKPKKAKK